MATSMVPLDLMAAGTVAAMAALVGWVGMTVVGRATVVAVVDGAAVVLGLLELLEQAAARTATAPMVVATAAFRNARCTVNTRRPPQSVNGARAKCATPRAVRAESPVSHREPNLTVGPSVRRPPAAGPGRSATTAAPSVVIAGIRWPGDPSTLAMTATGDPGAEWE